MIKLKKNLALPQISLQLCLLAAIGGFASAMLVACFIYTIENIQLLFLSEKDNYSSLDALSRFQLPIIGAVIILIFAKVTGYKYLSTGISFVLHRLKIANGVIPIGNTVSQFFGSSIALAFGFSVGKEGPAVHLGAACSSYIGNKLDLPYNAVRSLSACGIAAGIAACFNTPVAAVLFVMEVILREYKVHVFIPVMIAAIVGSMVTRTLFGPVHEFSYFTTITLNSDHYIILIILGLILGVLAFIFNRYLMLTIKHSARFHLSARLLAAAIITGVIGYAVPHAMGTGLGAIDFSLQNNPELTLLVALLAAKMLMTITSLGLGIPGGVIGPILGIGAIIGTCVSIITLYFMPDNVQTSDFVLMGMAGFMAATLNAPIAALFCVMELSHQIDIIIPAMIVIASACIISGQFCKNRSLFVMQLEVQGLAYSRPPIEKSLQLIGVIGVMRENLIFLEPADDAYITQVLSKALSDQYIVIRNPQINRCDEFILCQKSFISEDTDAKLEKHTLMPLSSQSTLAEAYTLLEDKSVGGVYIYQDKPSDIVGIITFDAIRAYLLKGKTN